MFFGSGVHMARRPIAAASRAAALLVVCTLLPAGCTSADRHPSAGSGGSPGSSATTTGSTAGRLPVGSSSTPSPVPLGSTTVDDPPLTSVLAASSSIGTRTAADPTGLEPVPDPAALLRRQHDSGFAPLMATLGAQLQSGARDNFLAAFAPALRGRVGRWFANTQALGVAAVLFAPADDYSSGATDAVGSFTRTVVLGIRTPYDDDGSLAGIPYAVGITVSREAGRPILTITTWQPKYLGDPMNCDCTLTVSRGQRAAVVVDAANPDLSFWADSALVAATAGLGWSFGQLADSGLQAPKGTVIFLADEPFHWFLSSAGPGQRSNVTAALMDAKGHRPGTRYSDQSRIVLQLQTDDGSVLPNDERGRQYVQDVLVHESTHQLMNRNSELPGRNDNSPFTWVVEGVAVAVETLHRDALGAQADIGYADPNDPKHIDPAWLADHFPEMTSAGRMPTKAELRSGTDGPGYYAIAGSVFRYLFQEYGYPCMLRVAEAMYVAPARSPFAYFPDPDHPGSVLPVATATSRWNDWFTRTYL